MDSLHAVDAKSSRVVAKPYDSLFAAISYLDQAGVALDTYSGQLINLGADSILIEDVERFAEVARELSREVFGFGRELFPKLIK